MRRYYKPSGKISMLILLYLPLTLLLFAPMLGFLHGIAFFYSPHIWLSIATAVICVLSLALLCGHWCVTKARVRNKGFAGLAALAATIIFCVVSSAFYLICHENIWTKEIWLSLSEPARLFEAVDSVISSGIAISRGRAALFMLRGPLLIAALTLEAVIALVIITLGFRIQAGKPYDEAGKRWVREISLNFSYIDDPSDFLDKLLFNDYSYLNRLSVLREVNTSYSAFEFYPMQDRYFLSIENYREKGKNKSGVVQFERSCLTEYLMISKDAGDILLSKQLHADSQGVKAKIMDKRARRKDAFALLRSVLATGLFLFCAYKAYITGQADFAMLSSPLVFFGAAAFTFYYVLCMAGSYIKEDVIILDESLDGDRQPTDALTDIYHIEKRDSGIAYKLYYTLMSILSIGAFVYIITLSLR